MILDCRVDIVEVKGTTQREHILIIGLIDNG
jgi:hypothetical protein